MAAPPKTERKEIEKYIKFFTYKALQTIIHSRSGEKTKTFSNANAVGVDWFNIALPGSNIGNEVQKEVKAEFTNKIAVIQEPLLLCVYLKTSEGFDSLLERWTLSFNRKLDPSVKTPFAVYNKLALLLKSLVSVTRSLPSYKLTRRKEKDFSFYYKILTKEGNYDKSGTLQEATKIGRVGTPFGTLNLKVHFQTKIDFYTQSKPATSNDNAGQKVLIKMTKDDTFDSLGPLGPAEVEELRRAALDDVVSSTASLPTSFTNLSPKHFDISQIQQGISEMHFGDVSELQAIGAVNNEHGAFAAFGHVSTEMAALDLPDLPSTPPFLSFIQSKIDESMVQQSLRTKEIESPRQVGPIDYKDDRKETERGFVSFDTSNQNTEPTAQAVGFEDDFVLVEVRPAFAPQSGDAGQLYRECQNPPYLDMFNDKSDYDSDNDGSITDHIEKFENQLAQYDEFFRNLEHLKVN